MTNIAKLLQNRIFVVHRFDLVTVLIHLDEAIAAWNEQLMEIVEHELCEAPD